MRYQLIIRAFLEERDEKGEYQRGSIGIEEKIVLGSMDLGEAADVLGGFHDLGQQFKEAQEERNAEKAAEAAEAEAQL